MPFPVVAKDMPTLPPMQINLGSPSNTEEVHHSFDEDQVGDDEEQEVETNLVTVAWLDLHERGTVSAVISAGKEEIESNSCACHSSKTKKHRIASGN